MEIVVPLLSAACNLLFLWKWQFCETGRKYVNLKIYFNCCNYLKTCVYIHSLVKMGVI